MKRFTLLDTATPEVHAGIIGHTLAHAISHLVFLYRAYNIYTRAPLYLHTMDCFDLLDYN